MFSVNLYKEYTSLKSRELKELHHFRVKSRQPPNCRVLHRFDCSGNSYGYKNTENILNIIHLGVSISIELMNKTGISFSYNFQRVQ